jgi:AcrR family transcriptional regulator
LADADIAPAPRTRRYHPGETRQRILDAAARLFGEKGYANSSTADLAAAADVSEGSIFYHFGSKRALLEALGQDYAKRMVAAMRGDSDDLAHIDPGLMVARAFDFCLVAGDPEDLIGIDIHHGEGEQFETGSRTVVIGFVEEALEAAMACHGVSGFNISVTAAMAYAAVHEALMRAMKIPGISEEEFASIRAEAVRFVRAACMMPHHH